MKCLVTGSRGFLGAAMIARLRRDGHDVMGLDTEPTRQAPDGYYVQDIRYPFHLRPVEWVFHFAGLAAVPPSLKHPTQWLAVNTQGTAHTLEAARQAGATRFLYAASGTCYGFAPPEPTPETAPIRCETPYALSKWLGEELVRHYDHVYDLPSVSLRLFNPYGPRMSPHTSGMGALLERRRQGVPLQLTGDGTQYRDWHYVDDTIDAFVKAAESDHRDLAINIGSGAPQTLNRLAELLGSPVEYIPARSEARGTWADITLAKRLLGWAPTVSFEDGVARTLAHG
jgi:UDP-glucose 4-epimerase